MTNRDIAIFVGGAIAGAVGGVLGTMGYFKKKYEKIANEQIAEIEEYYGEKIGKNYIREDDAEINPVDDRDVSNTGRENGVLSEEERSAIKEKLLDNYARTSNNATNYSQISTERFIANREAANNEAQDDEDEPVTMTPEEIADDEHKKNFNKPPRILSLDEYSNLPSYIDTQTLYFYFDDMVVTDDNDEVVDDYERLIGNCLEQTDFVNSQDEMLLLVMNYQLDTAYEIQKVMASYNNDFRNSY